MFKIHIKHYHIEIQKFEKIKNLVKHIINMKIN